MTTDEAQWRLMKIETEILTRKKGVVLVIVMSNFAKQLGGAYPPPPLPPVLTPMKQIESGVARLIR